jgi:uncharacterized membrane protein
MRVDQGARLERLLGRVLKAGSIASTIVLAAGLLIEVLAPGSRAARTLLVAGLLILMMTPVARVVASVIEYLYERDWLFALLTLFVLIVVLASLLYGLA